MELTDEDGTSDLEDGSKPAGLSYCQHLGADTGTEAVGDIIGTDAAGQDEGDQEADDHEPHEFRCVRLHQFVLT